MITEFTKDILHELSHNAEQLSTAEKDFFTLTNEIKKAHHIFLTGKGRSGLAIAGFANRLMHLGFSVSLIGEISTPHTQEGDLLIIGSGSGETDSLISLAKKAVQNKVQLALLTMNKNSTIAELADICIELPGVSPKITTSKIISSQPMGSAFEQLLFLSCDAMVMQLMQELNQTSADMFQRHANLE